MKKTGSIGLDAMRKASAVAFYAWTARTMFVGWALGRAVEGLARWLV